MRAEDVLADDVNEVKIDGAIVRKGSVGAFLANARLLAPMAADAPERAAIVDDIRDLMPALRALGLFEVFELRDPALRAVIEASS